MGEVRGREGMSKVGITPPGSKTYAPYTPAVVVGNHVWLSGQINIDAGDDIVSQTQGTLDKIDGLLAEAGVSVRALFHPVVALDGRRLSVIILVIDPVPQERRDALGEGLAQSLSDVHAAVEDHEAMAALMRQAVQRLETTPPAVDPAILEENIAFLKWLKSDHFVFLGARDYDYPRTAGGDYEAQALSETSTVEVPEPAAA